MPVDEFGNKSMIKFNIEGSVREKSLWYNDMKKIRIRLKDGSE